MDSLSSLERAPGDRMERWTIMFTATAICMRYYHLGPLLPPFDHLDASTRRPRAESSADSLLEPLRNDACQRLLAKAAGQAAGL